MTEEQLLQKHDRMGLDCFIAAAAIAGAVGVAGSISSGIASSSAAGDAANAATNAANLQEQQYQQTLQNQQPFMNAGTSALATIGQDQANGTGFAASFNPQTYIDTPGVPVSATAGPERDSIKRGGYGWNAQRRNVEGSRPIHYRPSQFDL